MFDDSRKGKFKPRWRVSQKRLELIIDRIKKEADKTVGPKEIDAGDEDLEIIGTNILLQVSGPQTKWVKLTEPLWVSPDKVENAKSHYPIKETWFVHHLPMDNTLRVIEFNEDFFKRADKKKFRVEHAKIMGTEETYYLIDAGDECVQPWSILINRLKKDVK
jgi:hypothetical protein